MSTDFDKEDVKEVCQEGLDRNEKNGEIREIEDENKKIDPLDEELKDLKSNCHVIKANKKAPKDAPLPEGFPETEFYPICCDREENKEGNLLQKKILNPGKNYDPKATTSTDSETKKSEVKRPLEKMEVEVTYWAYVEGSDEVLESHDDEEDPFTYKLGDEGVIKGLNLAISTMLKGETSEFLIKSE